MQRMKLYNITEEMIREIINTSEPQEKNDDKIIYIAIAEKFRYPIKVICKIENDELIIISSYPLKRRD